MNTFVVSKPETDLVDEIISSSSGTLDIKQCSGSLIGNQGQTDDVLQTLPICIAGMNLRFIAGTTIAKYYRFDPNAANYIILDGIAGATGKYVGLTSIAKGDSITLEAVKTDTNEYNWNATSGLGNWALES